jgi:threonine/homoserine/homoserine lactone efflux protein
MQVTPSIASTRHPFQAGALISFIASLPPGIVNVLTVHLAITQGYADASWFALGALAAEIICVIVCLWLMHHIAKLSFLSRLLQLITIVALIVLCIVSFIASADVHIQNNILVDNNKVPVVFGFITMAINPGLLPFWFGCTSLLFERKLLRSDGSKFGYLLGISLGSLAASALFISTGRLLLSGLKLHEQALYFFSGCVFLIMAIIQVRKMLIDESDASIKEF